jgi:magnesium transporter
MISVYCWSYGQQTGQWLDAAGFAAQLEALQMSKDVVWIDLDKPTEEEEQLVFEKFLPVHPLTLEDVTRLRRDPESPPHFPKAEEFRDYLFVIVNPLIPGVLKSLQADVAAPSDIPVRNVTQLSAVLTERALVTHHNEPVRAVDYLRTLLAKHEARADRGPDYLFHIILDALVDEYAPVLDHFDDSLDEIEIQVLRRPTQRLILRLLRLKREIIRLRKSLIYEREVLARLIRGEFALIEEREMAYYRNVYDHLVRFTELIESSREMVSDLLQTHLAATSNRLNEVMKALTMISTVVLPMTLVAGIYGMNFDASEVPDFGAPYGFWFAIGLMVLTGVGSFAFFRWKRWF